MKLASLALCFIVIMLITACGVQPVSGQIATKAAPTLAFPPADTQPAPVPTIAALPTQQSAPVSATAAGNTAVVNVNQLNLRVGPGLNYSVAKTLNQGVVFALLGKSNDGNWFEVQLQDGSNGWVFSAFVTTSANLANLPVGQTPNNVVSSVAPSATGSIPLTGSVVVPTASSVAPSAAVVPTVVPATTNPFPIVVTIANNLAQVTLARYPASKSVVATLAVRGTSESVQIAVATIDANGSANFNFPMPFSWPDGTPLTQPNLLLTVNTTDGSFSRTDSFPFFSGR
jgi:uncharacterized protein YgiM (DUF1202 family)